jgi:hypothetical protein
MRFRALAPYRFVGAAAQASEDVAMTRQAQRTPHEPGDVNARRVVIVAGSILGFVFISMAVLHLVYSNLIPHRRVERPVLFPQPRLQADEADELRRLTAQQRARLSGYHWADASHTAITIPIERAMQIVAARGAGAYTPLVAPEPGR